MLRKHFQNPVPKTSSSAGSRAVGGCFTGSVNRLFRVAQAFAFIPEAFGVWFRLPSLIFVCVIHSTFYFSHSERGASQAVSSVWNPFFHPLFHVRCLLLQKELQCRCHPFSPPSPTLSFPLLLCLSLGPVAPGTDFSNNTRHIVPLLGV